MLWLHPSAVNLSGSLAMEPPFPAHPVVTGAEMQQKPQNWETAELPHRQTLEEISGGNQSRYRRKSRLGSTLLANERENSDGRV